LEIKYFCQISRLLLGQAENPITDQHTIIPYQDQVTVQINE